VINLSFIREDWIPSDPSNSRRFRRQLYQPLKTPPLKISHDLYGIYLVI
jgi:hypothetical protein